MSSIPVFLEVFLLLGSAFRQFAPGGFEALSSLF